jgi:hypothetical protein
MRRGETDADMRLVANFIAAATLLQQDPSKMANEITKSRSLEHLVVQVMSQRCCVVAWLVCGSNPSIQVNQALLSANVSN